MYNRVTLVPVPSPERIMLDTGLSFNDRKRTISYPGLVIGKIKYEKGTKNSPALKALHALRIRKRAFSKYCIGIALLYDRLKHNRFKENLRYLSGFPHGGGLPC